MISNNFADVEQFILNNFLFGSPIKYLSTKTNKEC
jgi:hypothetical protein